MVFIHILGNTKFKLRKHLKFVLPTDDTHCPSWYDFKVSKLLLLLLLLLLKNNLMVLQFMHIHKCTFRLMKKESKKCLILCVYLLKQTLL
jgi:hypothetical protein